MNLKKVLKSKRGIALENAILLMLMTFMFCSLLISLGLIGHYQVKLEKVTLERDVQIDQIGEDFLAGELETDYENYVCTVEGDEKILTVYHKKNKSQEVLYVEVDDNRQLVQWRYSDPKSVK